MGRLENPRQVAQVLLARLLGVNRAWLAAHPDHALSPAQREAGEAALQHLQAGEPLPYVLGAWEFFGLEFEVTPAVLIPRPETELLVERALAWLEVNPSRRTVLEVGTGSGCIAVSLAVRVNDLRVTATDISPQALEVARRNASRHSVSERIAFVEADLFAPEFGPCDLLCANLPYIPTGKLRSLEVFQHEPALALDGGADGLAVIRRLLAQAADRVAPGGLILLEIEETTGAAALEAARRALPGASAKLILDLAGRDRLLVINLP